MTYEKYANIDFERKERTGFSEVIYCLGKTPDQVAGIMLRMAETEDLIIGTKASPEQYAAVKKAFAAPNVDILEKRKLVIRYYESAKLIMTGRDDVLPHEGGIGDEREGVPVVAVVTAGTADIPIAEEAALTISAYGLDARRIYDVGVAGIHRLLSRVDEIRAADVVIVCAGMEGALASVVGGLVSRPVIAVPTSIGYGASMEGITALLAMLNSCSLGVCVMNIDNGFGAGHLATMICNPGK